MLAVHKSYGLGPIQLLALVALDLSEPALLATVAGLRIVINIRAHLVLIVALLFILFEAFVKIDTLHFPMWNHIFLIN